MNSRQLSPRTIFLIVTVLGVVAGFVVQEWPNAGFGQRGHYAFFLAAAVAGVAVYLLGQTKAGGVPIGGLVEALRS
ncbi:MAG: hypothetical protein L6Q76_03880, partial [Polyangiaceae bacterium]|nr:hypothetical protein [Polyangiaceae bacterium]